jgi:hypothetical protein
MPNHHATSEGNVPFTAEEEAEWATKQAAWIAGENDRKAAEVRSERNIKLANTDWSQGADVPQAIKDKYAPYRQALREVPAQAGFPLTVVWPEYAAAVAV